MVRCAALIALSLSLIVAARSGQTTFVLSSNCGFEELGRLNKALGTNFNISGACQSERNSSLNLLLLSSGLAVLAAGVLVSKES